MKYRVVIQKCEPGFLWDWEWKIYDNSQSYPVKRGVKCFGRRRATKKALKQVPLEVEVIVK